MKPSPLRLEWLTYPSASFEALPVNADSSSPIQLRVSATVIYRLDGAHSVELDLSSDEDSTSGAAYRVAVHAVAAFSFDLTRARDAYRQSSLEALPAVIAVNIARIVYSSARELLACFTARAPHGSALIESVLIGREDVKIGSDESRDEVLKAQFGIEPSASPSKPPMKPPIKPPARRKAAKGD